jgi:branched-chain amino acid transport system permease protein
VHQFWPSTIDGLSLGAIYALIALGYTLVYGVLRLINFAHSEIFMIGTMAALGATWLMDVHAGSATPAVVALIPMLVAAALIAMAASGATAVALERVAYRPLRKRNATRLAALISAIGASFAMSQFFADKRIVGADRIAVPRLMEKHALFDLFGAPVRNDKVIVFLAAIVMMIALDRFVATTRLGRGIRAVAQDPQTATLMGVNIDRVVSLTFLLGGLMAGVAAVLFVLEFETTQFNIGFGYGVKAFTAAVLGGIGNLRGALLGGFLLGLIEFYGAAVFGPKWQDVIGFVILVVVLMFRPTGLLGESLGKARA